MAAPPLIGLLRQRPEGPPPPRRFESCGNRRTGRAEAQLRLPRSIAWWVIGLLAIGCAGDAQRDSARSFFGASTGGTENSVASLDIQFDGTIIRVGLVEKKGAMPPP